VATILFMAAMAAPAWGNPVSFGAPGISRAITLLVAALAIGIEVALVGYLACWIYGIWDRRHFLGVLAAVNVLTYSVFVLGLHRLVERVWLTEGMIWVTESIALFLIIAAMRGGEPPRMAHVLALAFCGNLVSFAIGWIG
jgi:hypothetical protein